MTGFTENRSLSEVQEGGAPGSVATFSAGRRSGRCATCPNHSGRSATTEARIITALSNEDPGQVVVRPLELAGDIVVRTAIRWHDTGGSGKGQNIKVGVIGYRAEIADFWLLVRHCTSQCSWPRQPPNVASFETYHHTTLCVNDRS